MKPDRDALPRYMRPDFDKLVRDRIKRGVEREDAIQGAFNLCLLALGFDPQTGRPLKEYDGEWVAGPPGKSEDPPF